MGQYDDVGADEIHSSEHVANVLIGGFFGNSPDVAERQIVRQKW